MSHFNHQPSDENRDFLPNGIPAQSSASGELTKWFREMTPKNKAWLSLAAVALVALGVNMKDQFEHGYKAWNKTICYDWREQALGAKHPMSEIVSDIIENNPTTVTAANTDDIATIVGQANPNGFTNSPLDNSVITAEKTVQVPTVCKAT